MRKFFVSFLILIAIIIVVPAAMATDISTNLEFEPETQLIQQGCLDGPRTVPNVESAFLGLTETQEEELYNAILVGLEERAVSIDIRKFGLQASSSWAGEDRDLLSDIFWKVCNDNPHLIFVQSMRMSGSYSDSSCSTININEVKPVYNTAYDDEALAELEIAVNKALSCVDDSMTDMEKALALHDYLTDHCVYNWEVATGQGRQDPHVANAYGALVNGDVVCQGYTMAYKLLLNRIGIVSTTATGVNHIWNVLYLDGDWYHVDVTWDDPVPDREGRARYDYFLLSDDAIRDERSHSTWGEDVPECTNNKYSVGYAFNDADSYMYRRNDGYYYVKDSVLYYGDLEMTVQEKIVSLNAYYYLSGLWLNDDLYFIDWAWGRGQNQIIRCDIVSGKTAVLDSFDYEQIGSPDGYYSSSSDYPGLRVDETGTKLEVVSPTRREVIVTVDIPEYPMNWEDAVLNAGESVKLIGILQTEDQYCAGILFDDSLIGSTYTLFAGFYQNEKMEKLLWVDVTVEEGGLQTVDLDCVCSESDTICLMLWTADWVPATGRYNTATS